MKQIMTNAEIEGCLKILTTPGSFRGNVNVKIPAKLDWSVRINIKTFSALYELYNEARSEIGKHYVDSGKTEGDRVKDEFISEFSLEMQEIATQENEVVLRELDIEEIFSIEGLSSIERDTLIMMCDKEKVEKYFSIDDETEQEEK